MKSGKATCPGSIPVELLEALQVYGIDKNIKTTILLNILYTKRHNIFIKHYIKKERLFY